MVLKNHVSFKLYRQTNTYLSIIYYSSQKGEYQWFITDICWLLLVSFITDTFPSRTEYIFPKTVVIFHQEQYDFHSQMTDYSFFFINMEPSSISVMSRRKHLLDYWRTRINTEFLTFSHNVHSIALLKKRACLNAFTSGKFHLYKTNKQHHRPQWLRTKQQQKRLDIHLRQANEMYSTCDPCFCASVDNSIFE